MAAVADDSAVKIEMGIINPEHPFWRACRRLLSSLQQEPHATASAAAAATALAQAAGAGRQAAASEALATLLLEGGDKVSCGVEHAFRPGACAFALKCGGVV